MAETEIHKQLRIIWQLNLANQGYYSETHKYFPHYIPDVYGEKDDSIKVVEIINSHFSGKHPKDYIPNPDNKPIELILINSETGNQTKKERYDENGDKIIYNQVSSKTDLENQVFCLQKQLHDEGREVLLKELKMVKTSNDVLQNYVETLETKRTYLIDSMNILMSNDSYFEEEE